MILKNFFRSLKSKKLCESRDMSIGLFKSCIFGENRKITSNSNEVGRFCYDAQCYCKMSSSGQGQYF